LFLLSLTTKKGNSNGFNQQSAFEWQVKGLGPYLMEMLLLKVTIKKEKESINIIYIY
jgi:hypothetical protein